MKEQFVTYEMALKLKELRFDNPCIACYTFPIKPELPILTGHYVNKFKEFYNSKLKEINVAAPLWQQVTDWLRITHNIIVEIWFDETQTDGFPWLYEVYVNKIPIHITGDYFDTYEEVREYAISYILNNLKCNHSELKREEDSCFLSNNCIYPKCLTFKDPLNDS